MKQKTDQFINYNFNTDDDQKCRKITIAVSISCHFEYYSVKLQIVCEDEKKAQQFIKQVHK